MLNQLQNVHINKKMHQIRVVNDNSGEVQEMENMSKSDIRIGPEINLNSVDKIENHSSFICLKCNKKVNSF